MEHTKIEVEAIENTIAEAMDRQLRELNDLQLTLVGGGFAEVTFI
jgi:hypothetical protein